MTSRAWADAVNASQSFGAAAASVEPGDGALGHPAARQDDEASGIGALDDLDGEAIAMRDGGLELLSGMAAVGEDADQRGICVAAALDGPGGPSRSRMSAGRISAASRHT